MIYPIIMSIAGSDCSGGAGIQADIKTISALGGYAASVITAITAQNTLGVQGVYPLSPETVEAQLTSVLTDLKPVAIKIGMLQNADIASVVTRRVRTLHMPIIIDPIMLSTSGCALLAPDAVAEVCEKLFPLATLLTPNLAESAALIGESIRTTDQMADAAYQLVARYGGSVLVKGGHLSGSEMCDVLCHEGKIYRFTSPKVESQNLHGTGCTLSSAIATFIGFGVPLPEAVKRAKAYVSHAIERGKKLHIGAGNGPLWHF